ncbi:hypothetical protein DCE79_11660 [Lysinibacillus sp. 2017]|uniref:hypothetical protein n=1 Tax=unclassified Lysinibacillus TaxID=2636778 RepID=UPI000D5263E4|nr:MULTISPECIES: hypothetical protein [unclassified Lysinibacillus]AWE08002.1 hypothetical protein DCE79_11660 [Lysinibacillus sp. 2017]TGN34869.1 hypothetical protein E4L99_12620 [Lysinibacillus sp. S2017]
MAPYEKEESLNRMYNNERGVIFPLAIILLFIVTGAALHYTNAYLAELKIYNSLESIYVRATINILNSIDR